MPLAPLAAVLVLALAQDAPAPPAPATVEPERPASVQDLLAEVDRLYRERQRPGILDTIDARLE